MYAFFRMLVQIYVYIKYRVVIHNKDRRKQLPKGGYIIACNHQFYADPPIVAGLIKGKYSFMAKIELFQKNAVFAWLIRRCGAFPVDRGSGDTSAIDKAVCDIKDGRIFLIFPEGTRSKDGTIGRGKSGVALIAGNANAPVLPVCLMYGLGGKKRRIDFAIGEMIEAEEIAIKGEDRRELKRVSERIMNAIKDLQTEIFSKVD